MAFGDKVKKFRAVKNVSTPESWATANSLLILDRDDNIYKIDICKVTRNNVAIRLINDVDRKDTIALRNAIIRMINWHPNNWWLNYRVTIGLPVNNKDTEILNAKDIIFYKE